MAGLEKKLFVVVIFLDQQIFNKVKAQLEIRVKNTTAIRFFVWLFGCSLCIETMSIAMSLNKNTVLLVLFPATDFTGSNQFGCGQWHKLGIKGPSAGFKGALSYAGN